MSLLSFAALALSLAICSPLAVHAQSASDLSPHTTPEWIGDQGRMTLRPVPRGDHVRGLPVAAHTLGDVTFDWGGKSWTLDSFMQAHRISGVMALKDGQVILERYGLGRAPTDRWASMSVAKSVTSLLAGAAVQDGKLRLSDPVVRFMPELKGSAYDGVSVRDLLMMASGVAWNEDYSDPKADISRYFAAAMAGQDAGIAYLKTLPRGHPPGAVWHYNTAETNLAGMVISRAVGMPLADYLSEKIWKPYGMERDAGWAVDGQGREFSGCCLYMTLPDYARLGQFTLEDGVADGRRILPPGWVAESTGKRIDTDEPHTSGYGYFWWIKQPGGFEASGIFGQAIVVYPRERIVIAINSAYPTPVGEDLFGGLDALEDAIGKAAVRSAP